METLKMIVALLLETDTEDADSWRSDGWANKIRFVYFWFSTATGVLPGGKSNAKLLWVLKRELKLASAVGSKL